jgi:hypothetical protein
MLPYKAKGKWVYSGSYDSTGRWELVRTRVMLKTREQITSSSGLQRALPRMSRVDDRHTITLPVRDRSCSEVAEALVG